MTMFIDNLFSGCEVTDVSPVASYVDGERTEAQAKSNDGLPLWWVESAIPSGRFVLPIRIKVPKEKAPARVGDVVKFSGVEANAWQKGQIAWSACACIPADSAELEELLGAENE